MKPASQSSASFFVLSAITVLLAAVGLTLMIPVAASQRLLAANRLAATGAGNQGSVAIASYQLASWLDPANPLVHLDLARSRLAAGQPTAALNELNRAGQGSEVSRLKVRTLMELGRNTEAATVAHASLPDPQDDLLRCLALAVTNDATGCDATMARESSPEALQRMLRAKSNTFTLAVELYAAGLQKSSSAILEQLPASFASSLLLGRIYYDTHTADSLQSARHRLEAAVATDPSSIATHQLLAAVYRDLGQLSAAEHQADLATRLVAGRP